MTCCRAGWHSLAVILVVISQIKINVTNAYSGSLAWTSAYTRVTKHYPGRIVFVMVNLVIALALMEGNMFAVLGKILGFYSNFAIAWVVVVATDISINKYLLKLSPKSQNIAAICCTILILWVWWHFWPQRDFQLLHSLDYLAAFWPLTHPSSRWWLRL